MLMTLRKVSWNKGQTDNGIEYDYCRIDCDMPIYEGSKNEFGGRQLYPRIRTYGTA